MLAWVPLGRLKVVFGAGTDALGGPAGGGAFFCVGAGFCGAPPDCCPWAEKGGDRTIPRAMAGNAIDFNNLFIILSMAPGLISRFSWVARGGLWLVDQHGAVPGPQILLRGLLYQFRRHLTKLRLQGVHPGRIVVEQRETAQQVGQADSDVASQGVVET